MHQGGLCRCQGSLPACTEPAGAASTPRPGGKAEEGTRCQKHTWHYFPRINIIHFLDG